MVPAPDAIILDSTHMTFEQVAERMEDEVRRRMEGISNHG
jgi:cytidylate kinase